MKRAELEALTLEALYRVAQERGMREASGLPREVLIERLADDRAAAKHHVHVEHGRGESARAHSRERDGEAHAALPTDRDAARTGALANAGPHIGGGEKLPTAATP